MKVNVPTRFVPLDSVCEFQNGYAFRNQDYQETPQEAYKVFRMGNIQKGGGFKEDNSQSYISKDAYKALSRFVLKRNDILMSMTDMKASMALLGHTALMPHDGVYIQNQRVGRITVKRPDLLDARYLYYYTNTSPYIQHLRSMAHSGVQVNLSTDAIKTSPVLLPPIELQQRIASILSAYDDLIENNTRRIKILEEMAQMIYREWFVHFRFPGHEKVRMVESELGPIPEGWAVKCVTDAVHVNPPTRVPKEGIKPFLPMGSLSNNSMLIGDVEEREGNSGSKFRNGDTLFARITPCLENGKTGFVQFLPSEDGVAFGSTEFVVLRSKTVCPEYVYLMARSGEFRDNAIKSMSGASGRQRVQEACFSRFFIAQPDGDTLGRFHGIASPMFRLIQSLNLKNNNLRTTRDLLLPKLISGEIPVEAAAELMEQTA